ncbi:hypothetical protein FEM48_Zijuj12G0125200 [Ziziphus jujuba var. spinosa]|uniref:Uncharacterized protein n=1 Tax=Ziziphus jujuba var. spinosa TaxID=714518 RepID=A0A978UDC4_ZIZJJ|nr:hypothetical protein FEM48_Zijuj12G0125200 [Ziziphus jujuba var. spinosa]
MKASQSVYVAGWRFLSTKMNNRTMEIDNEIQAFLKDIINKRVKAMKMEGQVTTTALLALTMMLLSRFPNWQDRAREEVLVVFDKLKSKRFGEGISKATQGQVPFFPFGRFPQFALAIYLILKNFTFELSSTYLPMRMLLSLL